MQINGLKFERPFQNLKFRLSELHTRHPLILPGDTQKKGVVLYVEDATFDFYTSLYPLLKEMEIRVLLAVAPRYSLQRTQCSREERLNVPYSLSMQDEIFENRAPFCTWSELSEMIQSGFVEVAAHSFSKMNLSFSFVNLEREIIFCKQVLEAQLPQAISTFIFPFGKRNSLSHSLVSSHYAYCL